MGWSAGKGLGRTESGRTDNVTVVKKTENLGLGAQLDLTGQLGWSSTAQGFGSLLESLNSKYGQPQRKAKKSKRAQLGLSGKVVAYSKRRKSKDVAGYSEADLRAILGQTKAESDSKRTAAGGDGRVETEAETETETQMQARTEQRAADSDAETKKKKGKKRKSTEAEEEPERSKMKRKKMKQTKDRTARNAKKSKKAKAKRAAPS
eukprot:scaffold2808_cov255-Pinguiococcus_pyrenoidosus.AAC.49